MHKTSSAVFRAIKWLVLSLLGLSIFLLLLLVAINIPDEELSPEAVQFAELPAVPLADADNGYAYLMGFDAPAGDDPQRLGQERIQLSGWAPYPEDENVLRLRGGLLDLCGASQEPSCLEKVTQNPAVIRKLLADNGELVARYKRLLRFSGAAQDNANIMAAIWPVMAVMPALHLYLTQVGLEWERGNHQQALELLHAHLRFWRNNMAHGRSLFSKVTSSVAVMRTLHLYKELLQSPAFDASLARVALQGLPEFSEQELDMALAWQSEFAMVSYTRLHDDTERGFFELEGAFGKWADSLLTELFFKPNAFINDCYKVILLNIKADRQYLAGGPVDEHYFDADVDDDLFGFFYNPLGKAMAGEIMIEEGGQYSRGIGRCRLLLQELRKSLEEKLSASQS